MVQINQPAPGFELDAYDGKDFIKVNLEQYKGKWVVIFFYPADFTFVCPTELGDLADNYQTFKDMNVELEKKFGKKFKGIFHKRFSL